MRLIGSQYVENRIIFPQQEWPEEQSKWKINFSDLLDDITQIPVVSVQR